MAVRFTLKQPEEKNVQRNPGEQGQTYYYGERRDISSKIALRHLSHPQVHVQSAKNHTGEETALRSIGPRVQTLKTIRTECALGSPHKLPS